MMIDLERRTDHADDRELAGSLDHRGDCVEACVEQRALLKQVVARIRTQPQFGEQREYRLALGSVANQGDGLFAVVCRVGDSNGRHSNRDSYEIVIVEIEKVPVPGHTASSSKTVPIVADRYKIARPVRFLLSFRAQLLVSFRAKRRIPDSATQEARMRRGWGASASVEKDPGSLGCARDETRAL